MTSMEEKYPSIAKHRSSGNTVYSHDGREERLLEHVLSHPDLPQLRGSPEKLLAAIDNYANQEDFLINVGCDKARRIENIILNIKPKVIVELGAYIGYSAISFGNAMRQASPNNHLTYWSLELEERFCEIAQQLVAIAGLDDIVSFVPGPAKDGLLKVHSNVSKVDFLFIDHGSDELYLEDFKTCERLGLLRPGSTIVADNVLVPGAPMYREYVRSKAEYRSRAVATLIMPGELKDELEVTEVLELPT